MLDRYSSPQTAYDEKASSHASEGRIYNIDNQSHASDTEVLELEFLATGKTP
jgi:hypothetical protein